MRDGTPPNKKKYLPNKKKIPTKQENRLSSKKNTFRTRGNRLSNNKKNTFQAMERLLSKGYLPTKCKSLQMVGVSGQCKAVVSDGW